MSVNWLKVTPGIRQRGASFDRNLLSTNAHPVEDQERMTNLPQVPVLVVILLTFRLQRFSNKHEHFTVGGGAVDSTTSSVPFSDHFSFFSTKSLLDENGADSSIDRGAPT